MLKVNKIDDLTGLEKLKPVWNELANSTESDSVFYSYEWIISWWESFGDDYRLLVLAIENDGAVIGLAPLMISRGDKIVQFIGTPNADYSDFLGDNKELTIESSLNFLFNNKDLWNKIDLTQISELSSSIKILNDKLSTKNVKFVSRQIETISRYDFDGDDNERDKFALKMGRSFKRFRNFFNKTNGLEFCHITDLDEIKRYLSPFFQCHVTRWNSIGSPGKFLNPKMRKFHRLLAENLSPLDRITFVVLKHGQTPIAFLFGFNYKKRINLYNIANESFYQKRSPGILLLHNLIEDFIRQGTNIIDFSRGGGEHKSRFINTTSANYQFLVFGSTIDRVKFGLREILKANFPIKNLLKSKTFLNIRAKLSDLKSRGSGSFVIRLLKKSISKLLSPVFKTYSLGLYKHYPGEQYRGSIDLEYEIKRADESFIEEIGNFYGIAENSEKHEILLSRFKNDCDCHLLYHNGRIVTIAWGLKDRDYDSTTGFSLVPGENEVVSSDAFTAELYRGRGIRPFLVGDVLRKYDEEGISVIGAIDQTNSSQVKSVLKQNNKLIGKVRIFRVFGKSFQIKS